MGSLFSHDFQLLEHKSFVYPKTNIYEFCEVSGLLGLRSSGEVPCDQD